MVVTRYKQNKGTLRQIARMFVNPIMMDSPQTKWRLPPQSLSDERCLTIYVGGWAHRGPVYSFLVLWLQIAFEPFALFHHIAFLLYSRFRY